MTSLSGNDTVTAGVTIPTTEGAHHMAATSRAFPNGFTWGTATAAHQIEGGNTNNDWWVFEHTPGSGCTDSSGDACDSWLRWEEDADLVAGLGLDNYRFSVEWSRIEPAEGEFSAAALEHYRRQCQGLKARGVDPVVTFHHFTTPRWLTAQGGWEADLAVERFGRFCTYVAEGLGDVMSRACTINEPNIVATMGWHAGMFPPGKTNKRLSRQVAANLSKGHRVAVDAIRAAAPGVPVGLTLSMTDYQLLEGGEKQLREHPPPLRGCLLGRGRTATTSWAYRCTPVCASGPRGGPEAKRACPSSIWATSSTRPHWPTAYGAPGSTPAARCRSW